MGSYFKSKFEKIMSVLAKKTKQLTLFFFFLDCSILCDYGSWLRSTSAHVMCIFLGTKQTNLKE